MAYRGRDGTISEGELAFLSKWEVDTELEIVRTPYTVQSGLNSFKLGDMHSDHSASENKFTENNISHVNWSPVWQGIAPFTTVGTPITINPTSRQYSTPFQISPHGVTSTTNTVVYTDVITLLDNETILRLEISAGEDYVGKLRYNIRDVDATGLIKYTQQKTVSITAGTRITFDFTFQGNAGPFAHGHPSENRAGSVMHVDIIKEDGTAFLCREGTDGTGPWLRLTMMTFDDVEVTSGTQPVTASQAVMYSSDYAVDTTAGAVTLTVDTRTGLTSFVVFDALSRFGTTTCIVDFGGGVTATLQTDRDAYRFYLVGNTWRFLNLATQQGGVV